MFYQMKKIRILPSLIRLSLKNNTTQTTETRQEDQLMNWIRPYKESVISTGKSGSYFVFLPDEMLDASTDENEILSFL